MKTRETGSSMKLNLKLLKRKTGKIERGGVGQQTTLVSDYAADDKTRNSPR
jgi:hypothetical protein